jgi:hypothetical protein
MTSDNRALLVKQITDLHKEKKYKNETLHLAVSIADRYLTRCAEKGKPSPFAATLAVVVMLMAAKLEQPISPSFSRMITLLPEDQRDKVKKRDLIDLEFEIVFGL